MNQKVKLEDLEKVYVDLPNHWAVGGESGRGKPSGDDFRRVIKTGARASCLHALSRLCENRRENARLKLT
jgi:hypothetical protein